MEFQNDLRPDGTFIFTPEEVEKGLFDDCIHFLMKLDYEFRVSNDGYCFVVEYISDFRTGEEGISYQLFDRYADWKEVLKEKEVEEDEAPF